MRNVAPLLIVEEGRRRPIGFVELGENGQVTGKFDIISNAHRSMAGEIGRNLLDSVRAEKDTE